MPWTYGKILHEITTAGEEAQERYLIEAIRDLTTDGNVVRLIDTWFAMVDEPDEDDRAVYAAQFPIPPGAK